MKWKRIMIIGGIVLIIFGIILLIGGKTMQQTLFADVFGLTSAQVTTNSTGGEYAIVGDSVITNDSYVWLNISPHTLTGQRYIDIEFESKQYSGDVDIIFLSDTDTLKPKRLLYYNPYNTTTEKSYICNQSASSFIDGDGLNYTFYQPTFNYTTNPNYFWCFRNETIYYQNGTLIDENINKIIFEHDFDRGNLTEKTAYWNETKTTYYKDVTGVVQSENIDFRGMNKAWYVKNFNVNAGQNYKGKVEMTYPAGFQEAGKYFFGLKRSQDTIQDAISNNRLYYIDPWYNNSFDKRINITFDNSASSENLVNFPVLVKLNSTRISYSDTLDNGEDIRFVDDDETTVLSYEIELWNESGDSFVWVKVPQIDAGSTTDFIQMYYKNNTPVTDGQDVNGTWDNNYDAVLHLTETGASPTFLDSSFNGVVNMNGTPSGTTPIIKGPLGNARNLSASGSDYIDLGDLDYASAPFTMEAWWQATHSGVPYGRLFGTFDSFSQQTGLIVQTDTPLHEGSIHDGTSLISAGNGTVPILDSTWHYSSVVVNSTHISLYYDGVPSAIASHANGWSAWGTNTWRIGSRADSPTTQNYRGYADELRLSKTDRSSDWVKANYLSQSDSFNTYGTQESQSGDNPPTWNNNQTNSTEAGTFVNHSVVWEDDNGLSGYIFEWFNGTNWTKTDYSGDEESGTAGVIGSFTTGGGGSETNWADSHLAGSVSTPANALGSTDNSWTTDTGATSWASNFSMDDPSSTLSGQQNISVLVRPADAGANGDPSITVRLYESGTYIQDIATGVTVLNTDGDTNITGNFDASSISNGNNVQIGVEVTGAGGGPNVNTLQMDSILWDTLLSGGGSGDTEANKTGKEYQDVSGLSPYKQIDEVTITIDISKYNTSASTTNGNTNPEIWLGVWNSTDYYNLGSFGITGTGNISLSTQESSVLTAWETASNRDINLSGYFFDGLSGEKDEINWTGIWVSLDSQQELKNDSFVSMTGTTDSSDVIKGISTNVGDTIKWRVYTNDTSNQWNSTDLFEYTTTGVAPPSQCWVDITGGIYIPDGCTYYTEGGEYIT